MQLFEKGKTALKIHEETLLKSLSPEARLTKHKGKIQRKFLPLSFAIMVKNDIFQLNITQSKSENFTIGWYNNWYFLLLGPTPI